MAKNLENAIKNTTEDKKYDNNSEVLPLGRLSCISKYLLSCSIEGLKKMEIKSIKF